MVTSSLVPGAMMFGLALRMRRWAHQRSQDRVKNNNPERLNLFEFCLEIAEIPSFVGMTEGGESMPIADFG